MAITNPNPIWNFISSFFSFLDDNSKNLVENFWYGINIASTELSNRANDFLKSQSPELSNTNLHENYYEIPCNPLLSLPLNLNPTDENSKTEIIPKAIIYNDPLYINQSKIYNDMIEISSQDYYEMRDISTSMYIVVTVKNKSIPIKYFKIKNLKSSEENMNSQRYYPASRLILNPTQTTTTEAPS